MTTFIVSGLWHGANWTFLIWGSIHGIFYLITKSISSEIKTDKYVFKQWLSIVFTFFLVTFAFVFFRADNLSQALSFLGRIIRLEDGLNLLKLFEIKQLVSVLLFSVVLFIVEWYQKDKKHGLDIAEYKLPVRHAVYYAVLFMILFSFQTDRIFIYFQF
jgi:D-alanyl-lipoteichoic acid acyltransferase DltB (MBOAT superfamily)